MLHCILTPTFLIQSKVMWPYHQQLEKDAMDQLFQLQILSHHLFLNLQKNQTQQTFTAVTLTLIMNLNYESESVREV